MKLPRGWRTGHVGDLGRLVTGSTPSTSNEANFGGPIPFLTPGDLGGTAPITKTERTLSEVGAEQCRKLPRGSVLVVCIGSTIGKTGRAGCELATNQQINAVVPNSDTCGTFAFYEISRISKEFRRLAGAQAVPILSKSEFGDFPVIIPPLPEQRKIADILTTWDEALEKLDALIAAQERRKKALMQQLLTGKRRLKGFDQSRGHTHGDSFGVYPIDWKRMRLGEVTREVFARNAGGADYPVLSCTKHHGLVLSQSYFGKRVHAEDTSSYRMVRRGEFAYATNHIEEGSIGFQDVCDAGLVSPIYTVFRTLDSVDDRYLFRLLKSTLLIHHYRINTSASVDRRGSLRYQEFAQISVWMPQKPEQIAIAKFFDIVDQTLTLLHNQRSSLEQQKRGLMQKLLTGKLRTIQNNNDQPK